MFVPEGNGRTFYIKVNKYLVRALILFFLVFFVGISFLVYKSAEIGMKVQVAYFLKKENKQLQEENAKLYDVVKKIDAMEQTGDYLRRLADIIDINVSSGEPLGIQASQDIERRDSADAELENSRLNAQTLNNTDNAIGSVELSHLRSASIPAIWPVEGWVTKKYDVLPGTEHTGLDIAAKEGTLIRVTAPGIVSSIVTDQDLGIVVTVKHRFGYETRYGHCKLSLVGPGEIVDRGQVIAFLGNTGRSTAPHVHYEIEKNGISEDPALYIQGFH